MDINPALLMTRRGRENAPGTVAARPPLRTFSLNPYQSEQPTSRTNAVHEPEEEESDDDNDDDDEYQQPAENEADENDEEEHDEEEEQEVHGEFFDFDEDIQVDPSPGGGTSRPTSEEQHHNLQGGRRSSGTGSTSASASAQERTVGAGGVKPKKRRPKRHYVRKTPVSIHPRKRSCQGCSERKQKCSRELNCSACRLRGIACIWDNAIPDRPAPAASVNLLQSEVRILRETVQALSAALEKEIGAGAVSTLLATVGQQQQQASYQDRPTYDGQDERPPSAASRTTQQRRRRRQSAIKTTQQHLVSAAPVHEDSTMSDIQVNTSVTSTHANDSTTESLSHLLHLVSPVDNRGVMTTDSQHADAQATNGNAAVSMQDLEMTDSGATGQHATERDRVADAQALLLLAHDRSPLQERLPVVRGDIIVDGVDPQALLHQRPHVADATHRDSRSRKRSYEPSSSMTEPFFHRSVGGLVSSSSSISAGGGATTTDSSTSIYRIPLDGELQLYGRVDLKRHLERYRLAHREVEEIRMGGQDPYAVLQLITT